MYGELQFSENFFTYQIIKFEKSSFPGFDLHMRIKTNIWFDSLILKGLQIYQLIIISITTVLYTQKDIVELLWHNL